MTARHVGLTLHLADLVLEQGSFANEERHELHRAGWTEGFVRLERHLDRTV